MKITFAVVAFGVAPWVPLSGGAADTPGVGDAAVRCPNHGHSRTCRNNRMDMGYWARTWIGANQLGSLIVLDANGNLIGRFGRYGNVDDADEAHDRLHFAWIRAVAVSDTAAYVVDQPNRRIVRAALQYAAEETIARS